jgi:hypothetical protein
MHIDDALIDEATGGPIVPGRMQLKDSGGNAGQIPPHDMILLEFIAGGLACRAVTGLEKLPSGFCKICVSEPHLHLDKLSLELFSSTPYVSSGAISIKGSRFNGAAVSGRDVVYDVTGYELSVEKALAGLFFRISGKFTQSIRTSASMPREGDGFEIEGIVPWPTATVKGYDTGGKHKFVRQGKLISALNRETPRNPMRRGDLMIYEGLTYPIIVGSLDVARDAEEQTGRAVANFLHIHIDPDQIRFGNVARCELLSNGFCRSMDFGKGYWINLDLIGRPFLEQAFRSQDRLSLSYEGNHLGHIRYDTPYRDEPGDRLGSISQNIVSYHCTAALDRDGLRLELRGRLGGFDPAEFELHRRERNSSLVAWDRFEVEAQLPWALLLVRDFAIAKRRQDFERL